jgi:DNA gyrase subunit A
VIANSLNEDTGKVAAVRLVWRDDEEVMLITELGTMLRTEVAGVNNYRRASRGVTVMRPADGDRIISIAVFVDEGQPDEPETEE